MQNTQIKNKPKPKSFARNGGKSLNCPGCKRYLCDTYLGEKNIRTEECKRCGVIVTFGPPKKVIFNGEKSIQFMNSMFTADKMPEDLTNSEDAHILSIDDPNGVIESDTE